LPLRHVFHYPAAGGLELEIKSVQFWDNDIDARDFNVSESCSFIPTGEVPLSEV